MVYEIRDKEASELELYTDESRDCGHFSQVVDQHKQFAQNRMSLTG